MPITSNEEKQLRELLNALNKANRRDNTFTRDDTRYSGEHPNDVNDIIKNKMSKWWKDWEKNTLDKAALKRIGDTQVAFIKHIEKLTRDLEDAGKTISKTVMESFGHVLKRKSKAAQDAALAALEEYSGKIKDLNDLMEQSKTKHTKELGEAIRESIKEVNETAERTRNLGIAVEDVTAEYDKSAKHYKVTNMHLEEYNRQLQQTTKQIVEQNKNFVDDLKKSHSEQIAANAAYTKAILTSAANLAGGFASVAESRLANVLDDTQFMNALRTGLSPQEINQWNNTNRNALSLMGESAEDFAIEMQNGMHQFGLFGKAAMEQISALNRIGFNSGIVSNIGSNTAMQETIGRIQALQGVSQGEATQLLEEIANSSSYQAAIIGKDQDERLRLLNQQAFNIARISRSTGFTAEHTQKLLDQQQQEKYKSVIDQYKTILLGKQFFERLELATGVDLSNEEISALVAKQAKVATPEEILLAQQAEERLGPAANQFYTRSGRELLGGNTRTLGQRAVLEQFANQIGYNIEELGTLGTAASNREETMQATTKPEDFYNQELENSKQSLNWLEKIWGELAREYGPGISQNPVGSAVGSAGGAAWEVFKNYLMIRGAVGGGNLLSKGWQAARGVSGGLMNAGRSAVPLMRNAPAFAAHWGGEALSAGRAAMPTLGRGLTGIARRLPAISMGIDMYSGGQEGLARAAGFDSSSDIDSLGKYAQMLAVGTGMYSGSALTLGSASARDINFGARHATDGFYGATNEDTLRAYLAEVKPEERGWASNMSIGNTASFLGAERLANSFGIGDDYRATMNKLTEMGIGAGMGAQADALAARDAMVSGKQIDNNGNIVPEKPDDFISYLSRIADGIEDTFDLNKEEQEARIEKETRAEGRARLQQDADRARDSVNRANQGLRANAQNQINKVMNSF